MDSNHIGILEAITPSTIGGAEVYVAGLCRRLPELGARVELFCPKDRPFVGYALANGITCLGWKTRGKVDPATVFGLARLIRKTEADVIHTHLSTAGLLGSLAARLAGVPSVAHVHGLNTATCYRRASAIIAVSEAVKAHLVGQGIDEKNIRIIHNGIDLSRFELVRADDARRRLGYDAQTPLLGVFGRLSTEKGQQVALEAMPLLARDHPEARLLIVGNGGDLRPLEARAATLGITDRVEFLGFARDVRQLMSACDAVIAPSLKEGLGLSALEAMALSRPVVSSAVGGLREVVVPGETGFAVPPNDPAAIAESLKNLIEDKALAERMGALGRKRVEEHFDLAKQARDLLAALREIVGERR
jgi:glycosyltransferase involved in cell wall biosynthesis